MEAKTFCPKTLEPVLGLDGSFDFVINKITKLESFSLYRVTNKFLEKQFRILPVKPVLLFFNSGFPFLLIVFIILRMFTNFYNASRLSSENDPLSILGSNLVLKF